MQGGIAIPVGGRGAGFFFVSDWTRAIQGGSFGLGVSLALLDRAGECSLSLGTGV